MGLLVYTVSGLCFKCVESVPTGHWCEDAEGNEIFISNEKVERTQTFYN